MKKGLSVAVRHRTVTGKTSEAILSQKESHEAGFIEGIRALPAIVADGFRAAGILPLTHYQMKMQDEHGAVIEVNIKYPNKDTSALLDKSGLPNEGGHHGCSTGEPEQD